MNSKCEFYLRHCHHQTDTAESKLFQLRGVNRSPLKAYINLEEDDPEHAWEIPTNIKCFYHSARAVQIGKNYCQVSGETVKNQSLKNLLLAYKEGAGIAVLQSLALETIQNQKTVVIYVGALFIQHMISCLEYVGVTLLLANDKHRLLKCYGGGAGGVKETLEQIQVGN